MRRGRSRWTRRGLALGALMLAGVGACQLFVDPSEPQLEPKLDAATLDAGPDVVEAGVDAGGCHHRKLPPKPPKQPLGNDVKPIWFAARTFEIVPQADGGIGDGQVAGLDLDGVCTCYTEQPSEQDGGSPCAPPTSNGDQCDEADGVDNGLYKSLSPLVGVGAVVKEINSAQGSVDKGHLAILIWVAGWNGTPDDEEVQFTILISPGLYERRSGAVLDGGQYDDGGLVETLEPEWDGDDLWSIDPDDATGPANTDPLPFVTKRGWVSGGTFVVEDVSDFTLLIGGRPLRPHHASMEMTITAGTGPGGGTLYTASGQVTGRVKMAEAANAAGNVLQFGDPVCNTPVFKALETTMCKYADMMVEPTDEFAVPAKTCDSISIASRFTAVQVGYDTRGFHKAATVDTCDASVVNENMTPEEICGSH